MIRAKVNTTALDRKVESWKAKMVPVAVAQAKRATQLTVEYATAIAPRDTNKYVRGWIQAGRQVYGGVARLPPIEQSKYAKHLAMALVVQAVRARKLEKFYTRRLQVWYKNQNRKPDKWSRRLEKQALRQRERANKAEELARQFRDNPGATVIRRKYSYVLAGNDKQDRRNLNDDPGRKGLDIEIRNKVYGGQGKLVVFGKTVRVQLDVLEPYSLSVERLRNVRARSLAYARQQVRFRTGNARALSLLLDRVNILSGRQG